MDNWWCLVATSLPTPLNVSSLSSSHLAVEQFACIQWELQFCDLHEYANYARPPQRLIKRVQTTCASLVKRFKKNSARDTSCPTSNRSNPATSVEMQVASESLTNLSEDLVASPNTPEIHSGVTHSYPSLPFELIAPLNTDHNTIPEPPIASKLSLKMLAEHNAQSENILPRALDSPTSTLSSLPEEYNEAGHAGTPSPQPPQFTTRSRSHTAGRQKSKVYFRRKMGHDLISERVLRSNTKRSKEGLSITGKLRPIKKRATLLEALKKRNRKRNQTRSLDEPVASSSTTPLLAVIDGCESGIILKSPFEYVDVSMSVPETDIIAEEQTQSPSAVSGTITTSGPKTRSKKRKLADVKNGDGEPLPKFPPAKAKLARQARKKSEPRAKFILPQELASCDQDSAALYVNILI